MNSVKLWLATCSVLVVIMVWIGGITRLTNSGLSITEWKPITGIILPITEGQWAKEKHKYENTPEYKKVNFDISMSEFKKIYIIEYAHRLFGRIIGIIFFLPLIYFLIKKKLKKRTIIASLLALTVGIIQAFMGWYMVKSGLINEPHVSQYRLSLHLLLAALIFSILWWEVCSINSTNSNITKSKSFPFLLIILVFLQIGIGGLVAGLKAGLIYNTFPLMYGQLIPDDLFFLQPAWQNFFENPTAVQFLHRLVGMMIFFCACLLNILNKDRHALFILFLTSLQLILGILTLLYHIPIITASLHQVFAFILLGYLVSYYKKP